MLASGVRFTLGPRSQYLRETDYWKSLYLEEDVVSNELQIFDRSKARHIDVLLLALNQLYCAVLAGEGYDEGEWPNLA